jgi:hypothetical protein
MYVDRGTAGKQGGGTTTSHRMIKSRVACSELSLAWDGVYAMPAHCEINADRISMSGTGFGADVEAFGGGFFDRVR